MRSKSFWFLYSGLTLTAFGAGPFALKSAIVPIKAEPHSRAFVSISTSGTAPATSILEDLKQWNVCVTAADGTTTQIASITPSWSPLTLHVTLIVNSAELDGKDPRGYTWNVTFKGVVPNLTASSPALTRSKDGLFKASKAKDDSDIYLFGSYLAGVSTKPIYVIDAKLSLLFPADHGVTDSLTGKAEHHWFWGVKGSLSSNTSATPPVDRTKVDPDAVDASLAIQHRWLAPRNYPRDPACGSVPKAGEKPPTQCDKFFEGINFDIRPLGGEFSRKYPASSLLTKGYATFEFATYPFGTSGWSAGIYPSAGYEIGKNLNQPSVLFKQSVDLTGWNAIARAVFITKAELYKIRKVPKVGDEYLMTLDVSYQPRVPFTEEPFVTSEFVNGKRVSVTRLSKSARHEVEAGVNWNITQYLGLKIQYKYGSLPPLFQFVDHQGSIGITIKAKQNFSK